MYIELILISVKNESETYLLYKCGAPGTLVFHSIRYFKYIFSIIYLTLSVNIHTIKKFNDVLD